MAKFNEEVYEKIVQLYKTNKYTLQQIATQCGCSKDTVSRTLQRKGLKPVVLSEKMQKIYDAVVHDFTQNNLYCKDIAKKYGVDEHSIYKILDIARIKRKVGYHSNCVEDYFEKINTPHKAYLLGFITADGAVVNNVLSIEVHQKDIEVLNFAKQEINPKATLTPTRNCVKVTFGAKQLGYSLAQYGVVQNKSKTIKSVPIHLIPDNLLCFYFRGLIDGDGCIHKDGKISIYSGSLDFLKDVQKILVERLQLSNLKIYHGSTYFITWGSKNDKEKLFHYLYDNLDATFYYQRKYNRLKENVYANTEITNQITQG